MKILRHCIGALIALGLMLTSGCVVVGTSTSGTALYVFDTTNGEVLVWDDVEALYGDTSTAPTRTLTSTYLTDVSTLGWGGMCLDRSRGRLWLVSETGLVARVDSIRSRSGALTSSYIRTFQLGNSDSDRLSSSTFGQMAVDVSTGALYITEYNTSTTRVWCLSSPTSYSQDGTVASSAATLVQASGDKYGYGVAVGSSSRLFAYCNSGTSIVDGSDNTYTGPRLRLGTASGYSSVIVGGSTGLYGYGTLAADASNNLIFVARANNTTAPIAVFTTSQFTTGYNIAPSSSLPSTTNPAVIRVIAHAGNKDWVVGSNTSNGLWLWKSPSTDTTTEPVSLTYTGITIRGIALDGSATTS